MPETEEEGMKKRSMAKRKVALAVVVILCFGIALTVGLVLHFQKNDTDSSGQTPTSQTPVDRTRPLIDCHPESNAGPESCARRGCSWEPQKEDGAPWCIFPEKHGYEMEGEPQNTTTGMQVVLKRINTPKIYSGVTYDDLYLDVEYQTDSRLRLKIYPPGQPRFEIPDEALSIPSPTITPGEKDRKYDITFVKEPQFGIIIKRKSTNNTIFNSSLPGFIFSDQYLQLSTMLSSDLFYGLGEHNHRQLLHNLNWKTWAIFTRDVGPIDEWNLYGAHPVYMNLENDGKANMVFQKNSNAMEVKLQPSPYPAVTFRTIGGILDFYIFLGDSPGEAVQQYTQAVGHPAIPPYWALGFHLCRWGYLNISDMQMVIDRNRAAGIPYDTQWGDIEYMHKKYIFTYDHEGWKGLPDLVKDLHDNHQQFMVIVDPGVGSDDAIIAEIRAEEPGYDMFHDGVKEGIFVRNSSGDPLIATVWPGVVAFPDFTNPNTQPWWSKWIDYFYTNLNIPCDALWIDMNEPASFTPGSINGCPNNTWEYPPYAPNILGRDPDGKMFDKTICMSANQSWGFHYNVHSLYGHSMSIQTYRALKTLRPNYRPWTMTRSSFAGTGKYATKWMGDNQARWSNMRWSIISIMEFSLFGFAMNGADICGFWYETTYELCLRWHQLGAFYPFARNHNGRGDDPVIFKHQDPAAFDQRFIDITKRALFTRYKFLPYLYTLLFSAHTRGTTVVRPLFFDFPNDVIAREIQEQFLLGSAMFISPVLYEGSTNVHAYFPNARWYDYFTGEEIMIRENYTDLYTPLEKFNLHIRGGHVLPWQQPATTTYLSRQNPMGILVALDDNHRAQGELFWDSGEEDLDNYPSGAYLLTSFSMSKAGELLLEPQISRYPGANNLVFKTVDIYGLNRIPTTVAIDGVNLPDTQVRQAGKVIQLLDLTLQINVYHNITWLMA